MEKPRYRKRPVICATLILLGFISFSCCVAAESRRVKDKDMRADGNLCSLPRRPAFGLGVIALVCLSVAQIVGTTSAATTGLRGKTNPTRNQAVPVTLLLLSWISFALAAVLLGTASSMNNRQPYGRGWMDGECYVVIRGSGSAGRHDRRFNNRIHLRNTTYDCGRGKSRPVAGQTTPLFPSADTGIPCVRRQQLVMVVHRRKKSTETVWRGMNGMVSYLGNGWRPLVFLSYNSTCTHVLDRVYYIFMIHGT
ncbi:uncharacterized protein M6B38_311670 [Iris pallida]|uniref:Uncharacterized protein n=1 Tax=Iris pallida TaxID=29817 RepID=A0AAX6HIB8_IRIPA|nr:uncharacterized protein M6B38_311670 [Iris pallida]